MTDLKPCPFCKSTDLEYRSYDVSRRAIHCNNCRIWIAYPSDDKKLEEAWNRRVEE